MKTRIRTITRDVPHTINGITRMVPTTDRVQVPVTPIDWDRIVLSGVSGTAVLVILASIIWSTASVGALLTIAVPPVIAYTAAIVFDATWIVALAVEWLSRYNTAKARLPRRVGYVALAIAMTAVAVHGSLTGSLAAGLIGGVISGLAKVVWALVLHHNSKPLDDRTQMWVNQYSAEAGAELAMVTVNRQLARAREALAGHAIPVITTAEDSAGQAHAAVRAAVDTMPDATAEEVVAQLARVGITVTTDVVREVSGQGQDTQDSRSEASITELVRGLVVLGVRDKDTVLAAVRTALGPETKESSVIRTLNRVTAA
ncbi:hypothetical protein ABIA33_003391 [Streptacidiphilus sp. MAP12-16]|uniref:protein transporter Sec31 n=1 Tax=Streptacidiphilus sp. MAP12-16 TaxID=3156300 RepID=UPI003513FAC0